MSAPSFSSFPPTFSSFPDLEPGPSQRASTPKDQDRHSRKLKKAKEEKQHRDKTKDEQKSKHHRSRHESSDEDHRRPEKRRREQRYGGSDDERRKAAEDLSQSRVADEYESRRATSPPLYYTDRKADSLNVRYGGLHAGDVPRHHLVGLGRKILGLDSVFTVVHRGNKGIEVGISGRRRMPGLTDSSTRHLLSSTPTRRLLPSSRDKDKYQEVEGFLRISFSRKQHAEPSYRSITASKHDARDSESGSSSSDNEASDDVDDDSDTIPMSSLQETIKTLEERLAADPSSVSTWLSLLSYTLSTVPLISKNAPKARSDITLSVLSRALEAHPSNARSKILRLKYLKAGEEAWNWGRLRDEWEDTLKIGGADLWVEWLDWRVRTADHGIDGIVEDSSRALRSLGHTEVDEISRLRILWRAAVAFREAGYVERATALFQAQAEFTYKMPPALTSQSMEGQLDALEEFWESEVPRIGEPGATGWASWDSSGRPDVQGPLGRSPPKPADTGSDPYYQWSTYELLCDRTQLLPRRSTDSEADADPYSTILFSDLRPLIVPLHTERARHALRLVFLAFLGLHVPGFVESLSADPKDSTDARWTHGHLVTAPYIAALFPATTGRKRITSDSQAGVLIGREPEYRSAFGPVKNWSYDVLGPFEGTGTRLLVWGPEDVAEVNQDLVKGVFRHCKFTGQEDPGWDVLSLAFETAINADSATRISKQLLAMAPDSLRHWAAHARLQRHRGRFKDARKVYEAVLSSRAGRPGEGQMWWDWAELEWLNGTPDAALNITLRSAGTQGSGGTAILRAKRSLEDASRTAASDPKEREAWIKLRALLELLTASPGAALAVLDEHLGVMKIGTPAHEALTIASLALVYNYGMILRNPVPPVLLRERAERAIEEYPSNTVILGMFLEAEKGQGIWGRVRTTLGENTIEGVAKEKDLARRVSEIWVAGWEKGRWEAEQERTRGGLSAAAQADRTRGSSILWRLWIEFEIRAGQLERAKKLLFRAVGECPMTKELYMAAFGPLRNVFSRRELHELAETMAERGLRMRRGLDEVVGDFGGEEKRRDEDNGSGSEMDEIEQSARERRRLMPY
ncbi:hypothetical protein CERSUDRAFT_110552 [Gelatoporia subvermispora B]|uniref:DUF1740-domain-containing protein n=1 Tax=Ceriporiopsis subvermispora (strain B) TaxID=914234 RepID=M2RU88_CERS8|nr:hypothetical protein CERSUDRAFT_110552 [Gelatoporia subvermispora B]